MILCFFCCSVAGLYDELCCVGKSHQMNNLDSTSDLLWLYTYTFLKQERFLLNKCVQQRWMFCLNCDVLTGVRYCLPLTATVWHLLYIHKSLISTYSVHALHTARRGERWEAAEGYLPDKLLRDAAASFIVDHEAHQAGRAPSSQT